MTIQTTNSSHIVLQTWGRLRVKTNYKRVTRDKFKDLGI